MDLHLMATSPKHRVLVVGGGSIGERHLRCFLQTDRCVVSLCDPRPERREQLRKDYPLTQGFASLDEALAQQEWDAAVIATPAPLHVPQALALVERGASVLIEKPLSTSPERVDELQRLAEERGVVAGVAYVFRSHPAAQEVRRRLRAGEIGPVRLVTVIGGQHFPTFRPDYREIYYARRETGGGVIQDALTHTADLLQFALGPYEQVQADWDRQSLEGVEVEDTAGVLARLRGPAGERVMAVLSNNQFQAPNHTQIDFHGDGGSLRLELTSHRWAHFLRGADTWTWSPALIHERDELFIRQANAFLDAVEGKTRPLCTLSEALHTLRFNLAALEAGRTKSAIQVGAVQ
jgi:predicted dehydrogenase